MGPKRNCPPTLFPTFISEFCLRDEARTFWLNGYVRQTKLPHLECGSLFHKRMSKHRVTSRKTDCLVRFYGLVESLVQLNFFKNDEVHNVYGSPMVIWYRAKDY
ncbi:hypothetical protein TNCV_999841 [Trichonephila clavipes]|nr:hypothetical protein TNCV_999841 [Trichonephila clavipes]